MGACWSCSPNASVRAEFYELVKRWLPEYIATYAEVDEKFYCPFGVFIGGFMEYITVVKRVSLEPMEWNVLNTMVCEVLMAVYPHTITVKGGGGGGIKKETYRYLTGVRMRMMP
jgi:hypothetical protein